LHNLLDNALRFTPDNGIVKMKLIPDRKTVSLSVEDSGSGILEDALHHVFVRFYRGDKSRTRVKPPKNSAEGGGTGLGLSIARNLALAHGGDLSADNHPNGGAVFTLVLPL